MYNSQKIEPEILKFWEDKQIFNKLRKKNKNKKPFSFIDGPITANNPMGVHHAWGRTYKDLYQRFKALQGYDQRFQNGFDCQGLWLEVETEKDLNFNSKKDIEKFGLVNFSKACKKRVEKFSKIQTEQSIKLGQWMDWDNSYYTMSNTNIEYIWYFLKKCHENEWLYKGTKILPWCIRCGTSSSQHEMSDEGYAEIIHPAVYIRLKLKDKKDEYILVWTTTEWTLPSNVAVAVNPSLTYVKVKQDKNIYYLSEKTLSILEGDHTILKHLKGEDLLNLEYEPPFPDLSVQKNIQHKIISWSEVSEIEGTGLVHIAPTCGQEDYDLAKSINLPIITPCLDEEGKFTEGFSWLSNKNVKEVKPLIVQDLEKRGILYKLEQYKHRYPVCWRCKEELVFRIGSEWFISCSEIKPIMKKQAKKVIWQPTHVGKLMQDWLNNMQDWNISRKRFWGLPLPFYECPCGNTEIIGSLKELKQKATNKKAVDSLPELHRPWIDEIKIKCPKCKKEISRILEVGDCWLDAGIVPFSTLKYFEDKQYWKKWFPAELIIEMRAQTRLWFYALLFMSVTLENTTPYKNVFAYEEVRDEKGKPMHKSLGNAIWFDEAVEKMGADVMRFMYIQQNPMNFLPFGYTPAKEVHRNLSIIWNLANYIKLYCKPSKKESSDIASKWLISKRETLKKEVTQYLEKLQPHLALKELKNFFLEDLSRWYGQLIRDDLKNKQIQATFYNSFIEALVLFSPFLPFLSEYIYQDLKGKKQSIFLESWPKYNPKKINKKLEQDMQIVKEITQEVLAQREKAQIGIRWPLKEAKITATKDLSNFKDLIKKQTNIKQIKFLKGKTKISLNTEITKELEQEGFTREIIRRIQDFRKKLGLNKQNKIKLSIVTDYPLIKKEIKQKTNSVKLDISKNHNRYKHSIKETIKNREFTIYIHKI